MKTRGDMLMGRRARLMREELMWDLPKSLGRESLGEVKHGEEGLAEEVLVVPAVVGRRRLGVGYWARVIFLLLMGMVWPVGYMYPVSITRWATPTHQVRVDPLPGWGSVVGISNGNILMVRGVQVGNPSSSPRLELAGDYLWDLSGWCGSLNCGVGTRLWGGAVNGIWLSQTGVVMPGWMVSVPAMVLLGFMVWKRRLQDRRGTGG